ncbi:MAG: thioesterase family protein [Azospirillaceae bacterium]
MSAFIVRRRVRFEHCDSAGIVFYPRYFAMFNALVEDWFSDALGYNWGDMHMRDRRGVPLVDIHTRFHRPCRLGETIALHLTLRRIGRSAIDGSITIVGVQDDPGETPRVETDFTVVFTDFDRMRSARIPEALLEKMRPYLSAETVR